MVELYRIPSYLTQPDLVQPCDAPLRQEGLQIVEIIEIFKAGSCYIVQIR
ncbi:MAG: hypothetical protein NVS4B8_17890 [Herpetosiphon sp.]